MPRIAVYGSLRKGLSNHSVLGPSKLVATEWLNGNYQMLDLGAFPGVVSCSDEKLKHPIKVEVYEVTCARLARLDSLEGHPTFYERQDVPGKDYQMYVLQSTERYKPVPSGDWLEHRMTFRRWVETKLAST